MYRVWKDERNKRGAAKVHAIFSTPAPCFVTFAIANTIKLDIISHVSTRISQPNHLHPKSTPNGLL
ncbi:predicted protein [Plenodomus lingam JN3]|uniref:Predicted protein n=1 Tax=Leptosphaeria maculans (strain JN3 / isolate v23.1.3 / race Av1-4-5-6-7-8) TaxID=985895 RepID=E4ZVT2_LEPMJ|nr:predicted protein [Plenodomus lingam JN3]CBX95708.1 predicted protein [Plenodomus lingam JN3]